MSGGPIANIAALEACLGKTPGPMHLKVIDHLDSGACRFLSASPLMFAGFGSAEGVNITLGLPVLRTSVDHGTALDLAGTGRADASSLIAAVKMAADIVARQ